MEQGETFKLFDKYSLSEIKIEDRALVPYISLKPCLMAKSYGRRTDKTAHTRFNIIERIANRMAVPGHVGKKHRIITSWSSGKYTRNMRTMLEALKKIEEKTKQNPIQIVVNAIVNASPRDEITVIEHAGARYPQAVDVSPMRRVSLVIRWMVQGAYHKCFGKSKKMAEALANEIMLASNKNMESYSMQKKNEAEKQADSAR